VAAAQAAVVVAAAVVRVQVRGFAKAAGWCTAVPFPEQALVLLLGFCCVCTRIISAAVLVVTVAASTRTLHWCATQGCTTDITTVFSVCVHY
jgi:hypothetical protein